LITRRNNVAAIQRALSKEQRSKCLVVGHDLPLMFQKAKKAIPAGTQLYYCIWQLALAHRLRREYSTNGISLAHHVTFAVDWAPVGILALQESVPIIWGPVGGASSCPARLLFTQGLKGIVFEAIRELVGLGGRMFFGRRAARRARLVVAQNRDNFKAFVTEANNIIVEPNAFIERSMLPVRQERSVDPYRIVGVGRLIPLKGWSIALHVLAHLPACFYLELYGDGPDRQRLLRIARRLGVDQRVTFMGQKDRSECLAAVASARCFLFPSTHDSAPGSVAEALSIGTPVVCLDVGGSAELVRLSSTGHALNVKSPNLYQALAQAVLAAVPTSTDRWLSDRCDDMVSSWYEAALSEQRA
jgi:glycosyltransferase involved in cell wall biosynthesis